ncbi:MAG: DUF1501 domain-containing protein [Planctomycetia bacterium]|nr:DUF1501 domain-containing protein [Planctomycetia bacterium]
MLTIWGSPSGQTCEGHSRRDFLRIGGLGTAALSLPTLLAARTTAAATGQATKDTSVIWLWLGGGATQIETFDPKMEAPAEFRSTVGAVDTTVPGLQFGGLFPRMAQVAQHMAIVRSFAHRNSGHGGGTHWVMTGYDYPPADQGSQPIKPSMGAVAARVRGPNHPRTGIPTFVRLSGIYGDGASWLGAGAAPFDSGGQARNNMNLAIQRERLSDRRGLLSDLDRIDRHLDRSGLMSGLDEFEGQAFSLIFSEAKAAFDLTKEDAGTRERYGKGLGEQLLLARRLCEAGCGFVNIHYGGWDMHGGIVQGMRGRAPAMDQGVSALVEDLVARGLAERVLLVITGEFGRTPRINGGAGRDHWAPLSPLAFACGGLRTGQVIGESSAKAEVPKNRPISPQDLMATVFHVLGIPQDVAFRDPAGRPTSMIAGGQVIDELV